MVVDVVLWFPLLSVFGLFVWLRVRLTALAARTLKLMGPFELSVISFKLLAMVP